MRLLTKLTEDDVPFHVGTKGNKSFSELKARVGDSILLVYADPTKLYILCPGTSQKYATYERGT